MSNQIHDKISKKMSKTDIVKHFGISSQAVGKWFIKGKVPAERVSSLCALLNWEITPHELRPDIYPNPTDGLPCGNKCMSNESLAVNNDIHS